MLNYPDFNICTFLLELKSDRCTMTNTIGTRPNAKYRQELQSIPGKARQKRLPKRSRFPSPSPNTSSRKEDQQQQVELLESVVGK